MLDLASDWQASPTRSWYLLTRCSRQIHVIGLAQMIVLVQSLSVLMLATHQFNPNDNWNIAEIGVAESMDISTSVSYVKTSRDR